MNLHKNRIMLVWPSGAKIKFNTGLLEGDYTDGRRLIIFKDMDDVLSKKKDLQEAIKEWISVVDK
jgi:DNA polymerase III sliding clamp (beta) subunit (PCNA family)